jgi:hypothetical protein
MAEIRRADDIAGPLYSPGIAFSNPDATLEPGFNFQALSERPSASSHFTVDAEAAPDPHTRRFISDPVPEIEVNYAEIPRPQTRYSPLKRLASKLIIASNLGLGILAGPRMLAAQERGFIPISWCDNEDRPHFAKITATRQYVTEDPIIERVYGAHRFNLTNIVLGIYEILIQNCILNDKKEEECSGYSRNMPLVVPLMNGNSDAASTPSTVLRIDPRDALRCWAVYTGRDTDPSHVQKCDSNGNWIVDADDTAMVLFGGAAGNYGKIQENPFFGKPVIDEWDNDFVDCSNNRCPEKESCGDIPYGPLPGAFDLAKNNLPRTSSEFIGYMAKMGVKSPFSSPSGIKFEMKSPYSSPIRMANYPGGSMDIKDSGRYPGGFLDSKNSGKIQDSLSRQSAGFGTFRNSSNMSP